MVAFILPNENGKFKMVIQIMSWPRVEGLATQIWVYSIERLAAIMVRR